MHVGAMARIALHHGSCNSCEVWALDACVNHPPRCSSSRPAASVFLPKGDETSVYGPCLAMKHTKVACSVKLDANITLDSWSVLMHEATAIIPRARAAKEAAVALAQVRADEVPSATTLARATAQSASDRIMFTYANSWPGKLPWETYGVLPERARLSEMKHHKLLNVLDKRVTMDDEWQGMCSKASFVSLDFVHDMQGSRFHEDVVSSTPSEGKIFIAAKSLRHDERVAKRLRASAKAPKATASAATAPPSVRGKFKTMTDHASPFMATNDKVGHKLLTATEEVELSRKVQDLLGLEAARSSLQNQLGREPALTEWAGAVGMAVSSLSTRLHEGRQSRDIMFQSNLGLVLSVAKKYQGQGLSFEDLVQAGNMGLIRGCQKFDPEKGFKFSTYAYYWIKQGIARMVAEQACTVRIPVHVREARARVQEAKRLLLHKYQHPPCEKDVAKCLGITVEKLQEISRSFKTRRSLDKLVGKDKNLNLGEIIADKTLEQPESIIDRHFFKQDLNKLLETLNEREMDVVRQRFGLDGGEACTLQALGSKYNLTRERVRQIETSAMRKLQQSDRVKVLKEYISGYG